MFIKLENVEKCYGDGEKQKKVINGIDLEIEQGEMVTILGQSGSGKSTLLNLLGGIDQVDQGSIIINNYNLNKLSKKKMENYRKENVGFVFQFYNLVPYLTARENVEICKELSTDPLDTDELMELIGLKEVADKFPNQLSGGQQQRCAIARALVKNPKLLLCDEPTGALDSEISKEVLKLIESINEKYKTTVIIVSHNESIKEMADRVIRISDGKIIENSSNSKLKVDEIGWK